MPFVVYIFALSAFALGLAEFVPIGLTKAVAAGLGLDLEQAGGAVTAYALGATLGAPVLSALTAGWTRRRTMLTTSVVFTVGSAVAALSSDAHTLLASRFVAGLGHGLFLAVASTTAAQLAGSAKAGSAVALVFGGFTLALAIGVPVSTWLGESAWRPVFGAIALFGAIGGLGLALGMKEPAAPSGHRSVASVSTSLKAMLHPTLLSAALVTVFGYAGAFTAFTYVSPLLTEVANVSASKVGAFMLIYGGLAAIGNLLGGRLTDHVGAGKASVAVLAGIAATSVGLWALASSAYAMAVLIGLLGLFTYAAVPALQARLMSVAARELPHSLGVAAGLNIAGFNSGIAAGSLLGAMTISTAGLAAMGITGALASLAGLLLLAWQTARARAD